MSENSLPTPTPKVNPETKPFWDATAEGKLLLKRCNQCQTVIWYPRFLCPACASTDTLWFEASGEGAVYSYTVTRRGQGHYWQAAPYVLAYVELAEGPRVLTNIVDCVPESVAIGQKVEAVFHDTGEGSALVRFRPA